MKRFGRRYNCVFLGIGALSVAVGALAESGDPRIDRAIAMADQRSYQLLLREAVFARHLQADRRGYALRLKARTVTQYRVVLSSIIGSAAAASLAKIVPSLGKAILAVSNASLDAGEPAADSILNGAGKALSFSGNTELKSEELSIGLFQVLAGNNTHDFSARRSGLYTSAGLSLSSFGGVAYLTWRHGSPDSHSAQQISQSLGLDSAQTESEIDRECRVISGLYGLNAGKSAIFNQSAKKEIYTNLYAAKGSIASLRIDLLPVLEKSGAISAEDALVAKELQKRLERAAHPNTKSNQISPARFRADVEILVGFAAILDQMIQDGRLSPADQAEGKTLLESVNRDLRLLRSNFSNPISG